MKITLTPDEIEDLETELDVSPLPTALRKAIERHLTDYAAVRRYSGDDLRGWNNVRAELIATGRRLLALLGHSHPDLSDAMARYPDARYPDSGHVPSEFADLLASRIQQWEAQHVHRLPERRQTDWNRRVLLWRVLHAFDVAKIKATYHKEGPRVLGLRAVLRMADRVDGGSITEGSRRLVETVYRHYLKRHIWDARAVLALRYEARGNWPPL